MPMNETATILVVDDNSDNLQLLSELLMREGYNVRPALSGEIALHAVERSMPDLILLDIRMPGIDGYEVCRRLKVNEATHGIPVIFISAMQDLDEKLKAFKTGAVDYIVKPFQKEEILARVRIHLQLCELADLRKEINERRRTEEVLRQSEERFRLIFEQSQDAIFNTLPNGSITNANPAACKIFGRTEQEICSAGRAGVMDTSDPRLALALEERKRTGSINAELFCLRGNGERFPAEVSSVISADNPQHSFVIIRDISKRRHDEDNIRRQNTLLQGINRIFEEALISATEETLGETCLAVAEAVTGSKLGFIGELGPDGHLHAIAISNPGWDVCANVDQLENRHLPSGCHTQGIFGRVLLDGKGFFTNAPGSHPDSIGTPQGHPPLQSFLGVPLIQSSKTIGMIALGNREGGYGQAELDALEFLVPSIVLAFQHKRSEKALKESERESRSLAESMPQIVWVTQPDGRNIYFNQQWMDYTGLTLEESYGHGWTIPFHPDDQQRAWNAWQNAVTSNDTYSLECRLRRFDGIYRWWLIRGVPSLDEDGNILKWFGTCTDIDEIKQAESEVTASRAKLKAALESMTDAVFISDSKGRFINFNDAFATFHRFGNKEECAKTFAEYPGILDVFMADGELASLEQWAVPRALRGESGTNVEYTLRRKDTGETWIGSFSFAPIRNKNNDIVGSVVSCRDITQRKRAEGEIIRLTALLDEVQHIAHVGGWEVDLQKNTLYWTDETFRIHDTSPSEYTPTIESAIAFYAPESLPIINAAIKGAIEEAEDFNLELKIITAKKRTIVVHTTSKVIRENGKPIKILGAFKDITEQKHLEEQLRQSQKMEAIGQLAGGVAHDFNNILTVISGYASLMQLENKLDENQKEAVDQILISSEKAAQLTRGLLAFSRKQVMDPREADLNEIVQHVQKFLFRIIGEDVQFRLILNREKLPVKVDNCQIEQVLINLAANARDAMLNGGCLTIETDLHVIDNEFIDTYAYGELGCYACITVSDTGSGMNEETRNRIFEPFYTTKEIGKGTGLGMAIVYGIVKQHNGFINVYSEQDHGTTFRIYLPIVETEQNVQKEKSERPIPQGGDETILLAEDDINVRKLMASALVKYGYDVIQAADGQEAVNQFIEYQGKIRLILMDMIMPKKNGREVYEEISRICPGVKVLYSSGYTADFIENRGVSEKGIELIMKPVQPMELLRRIRAMLDAE